MEPVVLLPDMMCDAGLFAPQIAHLGTSLTLVLAPITLGERIEEVASGLLSTLPQKFAVVGQGLGGMVAMELLRRAPDRVVRIALINTTPLSETPQDAAARETQVIGARAGRLEEVMGTLVPPAHLAPGPARMTHHQALLRMANNLGPDVFVRQTRAIQRRKDQQASLRRCRAPALVLCGQHDGPSPVKRHSFMAELIPHAELRVVEHAGRLPTLESPNETTQALVDWLNQPYVLR